VRQLVVQLGVMVEQNVALLVRGSIFDHGASVLVRRFLICLTQHLLAQAGVQQVRTGAVSGQVRGGWLTLVRHHVGQIGSGA
jgi:hypothetical protein